MNILPILINGKEYSWQDITLNIMGVPIAGVTKITYKEEQVQDMLMGAGNRPVAYGLGNITATASITLKASEVESITTIAPLGNIMAIPMFDIIVAFLDPALIPRKHKIKNCRFKNNGRDTSQGDTSIDVELELLTSHIEWQ